jgi:hypothetical protein
MESNQRSRDPRSRCPGHQSTGHQSLLPGSNRQPSRYRRAALVQLRQGGGQRHATRRVNLPGAVQRPGPSRAASVLGALPTPSPSCRCHWVTRICEPQRGFEPRTPPLRGACSGQLSYRGMAAGQRLELQFTAPEAAVLPFRRPGIVACAARDSNPIPRIKNPVHHQSCLQRVGGMTGLEPATLATPSPAPTKLATSCRELRRGIEPR